MAAPVLSFTTVNGAAYSGPVDKTPYMLRYEIKCVTSATAGASNTLTIANDATTLGVPNFGIDCLNGSPLQAILQTTGLTNATAEQLMLMNSKLLVTVVSQNPVMQYGIDFAATGGKAVAHITGCASAVDSNTLFAYLTIEVRHSIDR